MLDIICTRKEKTRVILFFEIYKTVLIIFKSLYGGSAIIKLISSNNNLNLNLKCVNGPCLPEHRFDGDGGK